MDNDGNLKMSGKYIRKQKKCQYMIEKESGIACSQIATNKVAICNAGLVNGLSQDVVYENFIKYGPIDNILMIPGKSYCFITFHTIESATEAFRNINGKLNIGQYNKPIYLQYIVSLPDTKYNIADIKPPGLILLENFITPEEESVLLSLNEFNIVDEGNMLKHRQVKHYGYEFRYGFNDVDKDNPMNEGIPSECNFLWDRLKVKLDQFHDFKPNQLTVNYYKPGQGIPSHVDTHSSFEDPIISLSLGSGIIMDFKNKNSCCQVFLSRRSLLIMSDESRYDWLHGITPRKFDVIPSEENMCVVQRGTRMSYTFRKIREGKCNCKYIDKCDSYAAGISQSKRIVNQTAAKLENVHVHEVYEHIASHFSITRHKPWPNVEKFLDSLSLGSLLLDVGCGNGKYLGCSNNLYTVGCDSSFKLIEICNQRGFHAFVCNCLNLPIKDCVVDGIISIAVIHHLANEERRVQAIKEIVRTLRIQGRALIYVWAKDQNKNEEKTSYLKQDRRNRKEDIKVVPETQFQNIVDDVCLPVHMNRQQFQYQDLLVPWKLKNDIHTDNDNLFLRFYHVFEEGELEKLCLKLQNIKIIESYYDQGNWCCILEKIEIN